MSSVEKYKVYKHTSIDGRAYVGITKVDVQQRWQKGNGYKHNKYFYSYIQKHGWDSLKHEILFDSLTEEEAKAKEIELISKWDLTNKEKGFNLDEGGSTNNTFYRGVYCIERRTEYRGTRIAERDTGISANNISYACNGKIDSAGKGKYGNKLHWVYNDEKNRIPEIIEHLRFDKEKLNEKENRLFQEQKDRCLRKSTSYTREDLWKKVYKYDLQGNLICSYPNLGEAAKTNNCNKDEIGQRCNGLGYTCAGYLWSFNDRTFTNEELLKAQNASNHQTILQYTFDMELVAEYPDGKGLSDNSQYNYRFIRNVCLRFKDSAYGYVWRFKGETQEQYETDKKIYSNRKPICRNKIEQYSNNGELVATFDSLAELNKYGWNRNMVSKCCKGLKERYKGFIWKYANTPT